MTDAAPTTPTRADEEVRLVPMTRAMYDFLIAEHPAGSEYDAEDCQGCALVAAFDAAPANPAGAVLTGLGSLGLTGRTSTDYEIAHRVLAALGFPGREPHDTPDGTP